MDHVTRALTAARQQYETAVALHRQGKLAEAEHHYKAVHLAFPGHPGALHGLGLIASRADRPEEAEALLTRAAALAEGNAPIRNDLGQVRLKLGRYEDAARSFEEALTIQPVNPTALMGLGDALSILGQTTDAQRAFEILLALDPKHAGAHFGRGNVLMQLAQSDNARAAFERAVALAPQRATYHRALAETARFMERDPRLAALEALTHENLPEDQEVELHFALGKAYDDLGRYADAFEHWKKGNTLQRSRIAYDERSVARFFDEITASFTPGVMRDKFGAGDSSKQPVFVVGMPRSGSSLVEQILASHPEVFGAGELLYLGDLIAELLPEYPSLADSKGLGALGESYASRLIALAPHAKRVVDKLPANFRHIGLIHLALPNARIVHVRRDPTDTCFSCYSKLFLNGLNFTCDLGELGRYYKLYDALMAHWRAVIPETALIEVQYESLVNNLPAEARRIVEFCGLTWDDRCLRFHETERAVRTLSQSQVRQPLFASSIGRWRNYEPWLGPLRDALG